MNKLFTAAALGLTLFNAKPAMSFELSKDAVKGQYELLQPQRGQRGQVQVLNAEYGQMGNKTVFATSECDRCMPAIYSYLSDFSAELQRPVFFNTQGMYVLAHDQNTFVVFYPQPFVEIGKGEISDFMFINVYNKKGTKGIDLAQAKALAKGEFKRLLSGDVKRVEVTGGSGEYHAFKPAYVAGVQYNKLKITLKDKESVMVEGCKPGRSSCNLNDYYYNEQASKDTGKEIYTQRNSHNSQRYIFEYQPGVFLRLYQTGGLGYSQWQEGKDVINIYAQDKNFNRQITETSKTTQGLRNTLLAVTQKAKKAQDKRYAADEQNRFNKNQLPKANTSLKSMNASFLAGAQARANREGWNETLISAYAIGRDWSILRHKVTGIQTGRVIPGVVSMSRKDGKCSYQHVHFAQEYNGSSYQKPYLYSIDSGQRKLACNKVR